MLPGYLLVARSLALYINVMCVRFTLVAHQALSRIYFEYTSSLFSALYILEVFRTGCLTHLIPYPGHPDLLYGYCGLYDHRRNFGTQPAHGSAGVCLCSRQMFSIH